MRVLLSRYEWRGELEPTMGLPVHSLTLGAEIRL
jgi:hypothetical protein